MDFNIDFLFNLLANASPILSIALKCLGGLVLLGYAYIKMTPTQDDDAWFAKLESKPVIGQLVRLLIAFSPVQRK